VEKMVVSFSGGKTSGFMCDFLIKNYSEKYEFIFIFANTGQEHEKTLEFVDRCDKFFKLNLHWVEAVTSPVHGVGQTHKIVSFETASRDGYPFEKFIEKSGIPNKSYPQCSDRLKTFPIESLKKELGLAGAPHAIGMRADEPKRANLDGWNTKKYNLVYPLAHWVLHDKIDVNNFWFDMPFTLEIPEHLGNCVTCWKKSEKKLINVAKDNESFFDFNKKMEDLYSDVKPNDGGIPRRFFRGNRRAIQIVELSRLTERQGNFLFDEDANSGCSESCEAYGDKK